jgi:hypothetical protein
VFECGGDERRFYLFIIPSWAPELCWNSFPRLQQAVHLDLTSMVSRGGLTGELVGQSDSVHLMQPIILSWTFLLDHFTQE